MKTLHILTTLTLSISTHLILLLGTQDTINYAHPNSHTTPIKISLSTANSTAKTSSEKNIIQTPKKPQLRTTKTTPPTSSQTAKNTSTPNIQKQIKPTLAQTQITPPPPTIKKTEPTPKIDNKTTSLPDINNQPSDILSEAHALTKIRTKYPAFSRRRGEEGLVKLAIYIDIEGKVTNINIVKSSGYTRLDRAAKIAVEQASFTPATLNKKVVASIKKLSVRFDLRDPS